MLRPVFRRTLHHRKLFISQSTRLCVSQRNRTSICRYSQSTNHSVHQPITPSDSQSNTQQNNPTIKPSINQSNERPERILIIGGGISGLSLAHFLAQNSAITQSSKQSISQLSDQSIHRSSNHSGNQSINQSRRPIEVTVIESSDRWGGWIHTYRATSNNQSTDRSANQATDQAINQPIYQFEMGPRSLLVANGEDTVDMIESLGLLNLSNKQSPDNSIILSDAAAKKRYLWKSNPGKLVLIPTGLNQSMKQFDYLIPLIKGLINDLRIKKPVQSNNQTSNNQSITLDESVNQFFTRHFNQTVSDELIDAMCAGIYTDRSINLSVSQAFNQFWRSDQEYGSLIKAMWNKRSNKQLSNQSVAPVNRSWFKTLWDKTTNKQSINQAASQLNNQTADKSTTQSNNQSNNQTVRQIIKKNGTYSFQGGLSTLTDRLHSSNESSGVIQRLNSSIQSINLSTKQSNHPTFDCMINGTIEQYDRVISTISAKALSKVLGQSFNQSINQSINQSSNQAIDQAVEITRQSINHEVHQSMNQTNDQAENQLIKHPQSQLLIIPHIKSTPSTDQSIIRSVQQSDNQTIKQLISQLATSLQSVKLSSLVVVNIGINHHQQSSNQSISQSDKQTNHPILPVTGFGILCAYHQTFKQPIKQSINQSIDQSINPSHLSVNQSIDLSINQSNNLLGVSFDSCIFPQQNELSNQTIRQTNNHSSNQSVSQSDNQINDVVEMTRQSINHLATESNHQSKDQSVDQPTNQSTNQPITQTRLTIMMGGARFPDLINQSDAEIQSAVETVLRDIVGIQSNNQSNNQSVSHLIDFIQINRLTDAIPQPILGTNDWRQGINQSIKSINQKISQTNNQSINQSINQSNNQERLIVIGGALNGVSVNDCVKHAKLTAKRILENPLE